ncbi:MAG: KDO2-lipid IV(A) lauroyltransferase [Lentimonas sp.]|jgi:KDO2-lipid IV(A) lauroyltransferase
MPKTKSKKTKRTGLIKWLEYWIGRICVTCLHYIPLPIAYHLGRSIGWCAYHIIRKRRATVAKNLTVVNAFLAENAPKLSLEKQVKEVFMRNGANFACSFRFARMKPDRIKQHIELEGLELLQDALSEKKGVLILLAHMGPWELLAYITQLYGENVQIGTMYRPMNNEYFNAWFKSVRAQRGTRLFSREDGFHKPVDFLRSGTMLGVLADQKMRQGVIAPFFGKKVTTNPLPGLFQRRSGSAALGFSVVTSGTLKWTIKIIPVTYPEIKKNRTRETEAHISNQAIEQMLSQSPLDGFWLSERF